MKTQFIIALCASLLIIGCNSPSAKDVKKLDTEKDKASYAIGLSFERNLENMEQSMPVDQSPSVDEYIKGIQSVVNNTKGKSESYVQGVVAGSQIQAYLNSIGAEDQVDYGVVYGAIKAKYNKDSILLPDDSIASVIQTYFNSYDEEMRKKQAENQKKRTEQKKIKNKEDSEAFLNANKSKDGVQTTASGLQYKVLKEGTGEAPTSADKVSIIYKGTLSDGTEFDSSNGQPVQNQLDRFVPGFTEGLKLMKKGGKYMLYIPSNLAYGEQASSKIGPNQALVFEVELVDIQPLTAEELKLIEDQKKQEEERQRRQMEQMMQQQMSQGGQ